MINIGPAGTFQAPKERPTSKAVIEWIDDDHAHITDPNNGREFNVTTRPKENMFVAGRPTKPRLYVGGALLDKKEKELTYRQMIAWAKDYFGPTLNLILNREVEIKFSSKAGCSCGCSPGFIIQDPSIPFNIWMDAI